MLFDIEIIDSRKTWLHKKGCLRRAEVNLLLLWITTDRSKPTPGIVAGKAELGSLVIHCGDPGWVSMPKSTPPQ